MKQLLLSAAFSGLFLTLAGRVVKVQKPFLDTVHHKVFIADITQLARKRTVHVYLPKAYFNSKKRYPVIYMQDGQNLFSKADSNKNSWMIDSLHAHLPNRKQSIIVGINNGKFRMAEYSPYNSSYAKAEGQAYTAFIVENLKPYIDKHYRTKPDSKYTAIAGSSMGGLISMYAAVKHADVFGIAGIFSPSFWLSPEIYQETEAEPISKKSRFFLACGDMEGNETEYVNKMVAILRNKGFSDTNVPNTLILKNAKHNEQQWKAAFQQFYTWFSDKF